MSRRAAVLAWAAIVITAVASRLAHLKLVWVEEAYGLAAAAELLRGRTLYSELWFDKPPAYAWFYLLCGARDGWPLRLLDAGFIVAACACVWLLARRWWGPREGVLAAGLLCVALTFWIPSAVMAVAPDLLMIVPGTLAIWAASTGRPLVAGSLASAALLCNSKGVFVLAAALLWSGSVRGAALMLGGFAGVQLLSLVGLPVRDYWQEVWVWGVGYARSTFVSDPVMEGLRRTSGWAWFHLTAVLGTALFLRREGSWRHAGWLALSLIAVLGGWRFFPRYYFALLPAVCVLGARGLWLMRPRWRAVALLALAIPVARFGPRYLEIAGTEALRWSDAELMNDSRRMAALMEPGRSALVWGYRPDIFVFSGAVAGTEYLDSQALTGVIADRHLTSTEATFGDWARKNREDLVRSGVRPDYIVDGLGPLNPGLAITAYPELQGLLSGYEETGRTRASVLYRRRDIQSPGR